MTEREKFVGHWMKAKEQGLTDIKFFSRNASSMSSDEFMAAANRMEVAVKEGRSVHTKTWEREVPYEKFAILS